MLNPLKSNSFCIFVVEVCGHMLVAWWVSAWKELSLSCHSHLVNIWLFAHHKLLCSCRFFVSCSLLLEWTWPACVPCDGDWISLLENSKYLSDFALTFWSCSLCSYKSVCVSLLDNLAQIFFYLWRFFLCFCVCFSLGLWHLKVQMPMESRIWGIGSPRTRVSHPGSALDPLGHLSSPSPFFPLWVLRLKALVTTMTVFSAQRV